MQIDPGNEGQLIVKGRDLLRLFASLKKVGRSLDAQSVAGCFVNLSPM